MIEPADLYRHPNALTPHYSRFNVGERLLLSGHSHQAWPDRGFDGQRQAWLDAAELVDEKWERAFARAERVRRGYARLLDDADGYIALASSTHDLVVRFLSALPLRERPRLVSSDGEFHTIRRQLDRLGEEGIEIVKVPALPAADLAERLSVAVDDRTAAVLVSCVLFETAYNVPGLRELLGACQRVGAELLVDAYHALNVVPFSLREQGLEDAFVVGGGYKYCQLGEGNCFLRFPQDRDDLRPAVTGWFSEFSALASRTEGGVIYPHGPDRFAGATYDPTSHYRASEVLDFFTEHELTPELLREVSQHQIRLLADRFDAVDADPSLITRDHSVGLDGIGGFLALQTPKAAEVCRRLRELGVHTDYRGEILRLGPAPYLSDRQLESAMDALDDVIRARL